jgi:metal-sulfur cluster biosynthetic enzyme
MAGRPDERKLRSVIEGRLAGIIDPGAGLDVFRMGLVRDLAITGTGDVSFTFRPSSPVCPIAFTLAPAIKEAIESVPGVLSVSMRIENFNQAAELEALLAEETG